MQKECKKIHVRACIEIVAKAKRSATRKGRGVASREAEIRPTRRRGRENHHPA